MSWPAGNIRCPEPSVLRDAARRMRAREVEKAEASKLAQSYRTWITIASRLEGTARDERPDNPRKIMRDMARGRIPFGRR